MHLSHVEGEINNSSQERSCLHRHLGKELHGDEQGEVSLIYRITSEKKFNLYNLIHKTIGEDLTK